MEFPEIDKIVRLHEDGKASLSPCSLASPPVASISSTASLSKLRLGRLFVLLALELEVDVQIAATGLGGGFARRILLLWSGKVRNTP